MKIQRVLITSTLLFITNLSLVYAQNVDYFIQETNALSNGRGMMFYDRKMYLDSAFSMISRGRELHNDPMISKLYSKILEQRRYLFYTLNSPVEKIMAFLEEVKKSVDQYPEDSALFRVELGTHLHLLKKYLLTDQSVDNTIKDIHERSAGRIDPFAELSLLVVELSYKESYCNKLMKSWIVYNAKISGTTEVKKAIEFLNSLLRLSVDKQMACNYMTIKNLFPKEHEVDEFQNDIASKILEDFVGLKPSLHSILELKYYLDMYPTFGALLDFFKNWILNLADEYTSSKQWSRAGIVFHLAKPHFPNDSDLLFIKKKWVIDDYKENYLGSAVSTAELNWTGSTANCDPGTISDVSSTKVVQRVNYFRRLAGVPDDIILDKSINEESQKRH